VLETSIAGLRRKKWRKLRKGFNVELNKRSGIRSLGWYGIRVKVVPKVDGRGGGGAGRSWRLSGESALVAKLVWAYEGIPLRMNYKKVTVLKSVLGLPTDDHPPRGPRRTSMEKRRAGCG
jgi:hypothetical protein